MNVFVPDVPLVDGTLFPLRDVLEHSLQFLFDVWVFKYRSSVLGAPDDVIVTDPRTVGLLVQTTVHMECSLVVGNIDHRDSLKDFVFKRTPRLKPGVYFFKKWSWGEKLAPLHSR